MNTSPLLYFHLQDKYSGLNVTLRQYKYENTVTYEDPESIRTLYLINSVRIH